MRTLVTALILLPFALGVVASGANADEAGTSTAYTRDSLRAVGIPGSVLVAQACGGSVSCCGTTDQKGNVSGKTCTCYYTSSGTAPCGVR